MNNRATLEQLELFEDPEMTRFRLQMAASMETVHKDVAKYKESSDKTRRGLFARYDQLANDYADLLKLCNELKAKAGL